MRTLARPPQRAHLLRAASPLMGTSCCLRGPSLPNGMLLILNRMESTASDEWARWILVLSLGGFFGNFVLSLTDHAENGFFH
jgi:hypothetical protein